MTVAVAAGRGGSAGCSSEGGDRGGGGGAGGWLGGWWWSRCGFGGASTSQSPVIPQLIFVDVAFTLPARISSARGAKREQLALALRRACKRERKVTCLYLCMYVCMHGLPRVPVHVSMHVQTEMQVCLSPCLRVWASTNLDLPPS